jgi:hypothetical protein
MYSIDFKQFDIVTACVIKCLSSINKSEIYSKKISFTQIHIDEPLGCISVARCVYIIEGALNVDRIEFEIHDAKL